MLYGFSLCHGYEGKKLMDINNMKNFYVKRIISVYSLYIVTCILYFLFFNNLSIRENIILAPYEGLALQSHFNSLFGIGHNRGTWFISCIMFSYFLFPFLLEIISQVSLKTVRIFGGLIYLLLSGAPLIVKVFETDSIYTSPFFRTLEFTVGMIVCKCYKKRKDDIKTLKNIVVIIVSSVLLIGAIIWLTDYGIGRFTFYSIYYAFFVVPIFAILLYCFASVEHKKESEGRKNQIIPLLAKGSYACYLSQFFVWDVTKLILEEYNGGTI